MSMNVGPAKIVLNEFDGRGVLCEAFADRLAMVLAVINNGRIQRASYGGYGSDEHLAALNEIEKQIAAVRECIAESRKRDEEMENGNWCSECDAAHRTGCPVHCELSITEQCTCTAQRRGGEQ